MDLCNGMGRIICLTYFYHANDFRKNWYIWQGELVKDDFETEKNNKTLNHLGENLNLKSETRD